MLTIISPQPRPTSQGHQRPARCLHHIPEVSGAFTRATSRYHIRAKINTAISFFILDSTAGRPIYNTRISFLDD